MIDGRGIIVSEYVDVGCGRRMPWSRRPRAAALLAAIAEPGRGFEAVVVGEYERAFVGDQLLELLPLLEEHGVQLWLPECGGPLDRSDPEHVALVRLLGSSSRREVSWARFRVLAAMRAQVIEQGRYLGGRPPYGYRLEDAGRHPNAAHAGWGRRLHRLVPDTVTAPWVRWMFARRLEGWSRARIARELNIRGVASPSLVDRERNRHRRGAAWVVPSVSSILANPRYTGRQVWNRQQSDRDQWESGVGPWRGWNPAGEWVVSRELAHEPLVSEEDFIAVQAVYAVQPPADGSVRRYLLVGLVRCGECGRRMESCWVHGRAGYRCRHGRTSGTPVQPGQRKNLYLREDRILERIAVDVAGLDTPCAAEEVMGLQPMVVVELIRSQGLVITCRGFRLPARQRGTNWPPRERPGRRG